MSIEIKQLKASHEEVLQHLQEFENHKDFKSRLVIIKQGKPVIAKYFKHSIALTKALHDAKVSNQHLESTLRRYAADTNEEAKNIIALYLKYSHGCETSHRLKFQKDVAEINTLLTHRVKNETEYLIPEYVSSLGNNSEVSA